MLTIDEREVLITAMDFVAQHWAAFQSEYEARTGEELSEELAKSAEDKIYKMPVKRGSK